MRRLQAFLLATLTASSLNIQVLAEEVKSTVLTPSANAKSSWRLVEDQELEKLNAKAYPPGEEWQRFQDQAVYHFTHGQYHQAEYEIKEGIEYVQKTGKTTHLAAFYDLLGADYRAQAHYDEAIQAYQQSLTLQQQKAKPDDISIGLTLNNIGEVYRAEGQLQQALPVLLQGKTKLSTDKPGYDVLMQNLGMTYVGLNQPAEAEHAFQEGIAHALNPQFYNARQAVESLYSLSLLYGKQKRIPELLSILNQAIPLSKAAYGEQDKHTLNLEAFQQATLKATETPAYQWTTAMSQGQRAMNDNHFSEAALHFETALKLVSASADEKPPKVFAVTHANLGTAYLFANQPIKAQTELALAINLYKQYLPTDQRQIQALEEGLRLAQSRQRAMMTAKPMSKP